MSLSAKRNAFLVPAFGLCRTLVGCGLLLLAHPAMAQAFRQPFAVGAQERPVGRVSGLSAWIIGQESRFYLLMEHTLDHAKHSHLALAGLLGLAFAYGVFHAAGPGHGKAVITSYMVSNERALRRGIIIAFLAALLQGLVAIVAIGGAAVLFNATAQGMINTAHVLELCAYCGIILLGLMLVFRKGSSVLRTIRRMLADAAPRWALDTGGELATEPSIVNAFVSTPQPSSGAKPRRSAFMAVATNEIDDLAGCGPQCAHLLALDPRELGDEFSWRSAALTIVTAGARPCSGAILVLIFSLAQGILPLGVAAVGAIASGTGLTTAGLAITAVYGKKLAVRIAGRKQSPRAYLMGQFVEFGAAFCVLLFGATLLYASWTGMMSVN